MYRSAILLLGLGLALALPCFDPKLRGTTISQSTSLHGDEQPHFSWVINHPERGQAQSAYQITVNNADGSVHWDSGMVKSDRTYFVPYSGPALAPETTYTWSVIWWDTNANPSLPVAPSPSASFTTGIVDWNGSDWISSNKNEAYLRRDFAVPKDVVSAKLYVTGMGFFDAWINGELVTNYFGGGWTTFRARLLYQIIDVTAQIKADSANAIGAVTSRGWADWNSFPSRTGDIKSFPAPSIRFLLRMMLKDGSNVTVGTDSHWKFGAGALSDATVYDGETYDARKEQVGWNMPNFQPSFFKNWSSVKVVDSPTALVSRMMHPPIKHLATFDPVAITQPKPGVYVVKFPHNLSGMVRLKHVVGKAGTKITVRHAEILIHPPYTGEAGMIYTENLRSAKATDVFILKGSTAGEAYSPRNTYHGFQYVEVTGFPGELKAENIEQLFVATAVEQRGDVKFDSQMLSNLQERVVRGQHDNLMSIPTDCNQRDERLGWMGDANLSADSMCLNFDIYTFFANYLRLIRDEQGTDGAVPDVVPCQRYAARPGDVSWATAYTTLAWTLYRYYGDLSAPKEQQAGLEAFVGWMDKYAKDNGLDQMYATFGDWCPPPPAKMVDPHFTASFSYVDAMKKMTELEAAMGNAKTSIQYGNESSQLIQQFEDVWYDPQTKMMESGFQADYALSMDLGVPSSKAFGDALLNLLFTKDNLHFTTGIIGLKSLFPILSSMGREDVALDIVSQVTYPSFGYEQGNMQEPASTIWELMDAPVEGPGMNSRNHHMFSSVSKWLYHLAGLEQPDGALGAGFEHVKLVPRPMLGLQAGSVTLNAPRGLISLDWSQTGGKQCQKVMEGQTMTVSCGDNGVITKIAGSFGQPTGGCATGYKVNDQCHWNTTNAVLEAACLGKTECNVQAVTIVFGEPCFGSVKQLLAAYECSNPAKLVSKAIVPPGSTATIKIPTIGATPNDVMIHESGNVWWSEGVFMGNDEAVKEVTATADHVVFEVGSGEYSFVMSQ